jgi:hypothetical protein
MDIKELALWIKDLDRHLNDKQKRIASEILKEISQRLQFLLDVGLKYGLYEGKNPVGFFYELDGRRVHVIHRQKLSVEAFPQIPTPQVYAFTTEFCPERKIYRMYQSLRINALSHRKETVVH